MKEPRVYVLSADNAEEFGGGFAIDSWVDYEEEHQELSEEAEDFVKEAEKNGSVYSLKGFMVAHNINEEVGMNDFVFITSAY